MQILNSGSFINLDNHEKIQHLIFTARSIADSAVETDGFVNAHENNRRLALEIWQGAGYMTRSTEESQVKNIFINNFLERLRELAGSAPAAVAVANNLPAIAATQPEENPPRTGADDSKDEFLGLVTTPGEQARQGSGEPDFNAAENAEPINVSGVTQPEDKAAAAAETTDRVENSAGEIINPDERSHNETVEAEKVEAEIEKSVEPSEERPEETPSSSGTLQGSVGTIKLPEKEPYRWEGCTVTATIQLLPAEVGRRRVVLSVRTHDFAPQISMAEIGEGAVPEQILPALAAAFEKYKTDLPVKVMDKLKRDRSGVKKQVPQTTVEQKTEAATAAPKTKNNQTPPPDGVASAQSVASQPNAETDRTKTTLNSKPKEEIQGNLFGF